LKVLFEAKDEPNLDREARETAAGAIVYVLAPEPSTTGQEPDFVAFADDTVVVRAALQAIAATGGEGAADFKTRFAEHYQTLDDDLELCKGAMGDAYAWLEGKVPGLKKLAYKGKKLAIYIDDDEAQELLYEDGLAFATDYPIDEEKLSMRLKKPETILEPLKRKAAAEKQKIA
jgi:hypothetical protein